MQIVVQALIRRVFAHKPRPLGRGGCPTIPVELLGINGVGNYSVSPIRIF